VPVRANDRSTPVTDRQRFDLTEIDGGGLLLDLQTGQILALNDIAFQIWRQFLDYVPNARIADGLARRYEISRDAATADVALALTVPTGVERRRDLDFEYRVTPSGRHLALSEEIPLLELGPTGDHVVVLRQVTSTELESCLRGMAPKLLALAGELVLHASCVSNGSQAVVFQGSSGAGKTTTAHAFGSAAVKVLAEDMLIVTVARGLPRVVVDTETLIKDWARTASLGTIPIGTIIAFHPPLPDEGLRTVPLARLCFIDRADRTGSIIERVALSKAETTALSFCHSFVSSLEAAPLHAHLANVMALTETVPGYRLQLPDGVPLLRAAAEAYSALWTE
jgi:hypothetical protein